jgi:DNA-directed RNA polymerase specialized sigma24 family protein
LSASGVEPGRPVRPWLYTIAKHQAIDIRLAHVRQGGGEGK